PTARRQEDLLFPEPSRALPQGLISPLTGRPWLVWVLAAAAGFPEAAPPDARQSERRPRSTEAALPFQERWFGHSKPPLRTPAVSVSPNTSSAPETHTLTAARKLSRN